MFEKLPAVVIFGIMPKNEQLQISTEFGSSELFFRAVTDSVNDVRTFLSSCWERLCGIYLPMNISKEIKDAITRYVACRHDVKVIYFQG